METIYHFTKISTLVELILPTMLLKLNSIENMNDPRETKIFGFSQITDSVDNSSLEKNNKEFSDFIKKNIKICSFVKNATVGDSIIEEYGVQRDAGTALVLVALREVKGAEEIDADGEVSVTAHDLSGTRQAIELRKVEAGGYTDLIGTARVSPRNSYRFEVVVTAGGRTETVTFQRNF